MGMDNSEIQASEEQGAVHATRSLAFPRTSSRPSVTYRRSNWVDISRSNWVDISRSNWVDISRSNWVDISRSNWVDISL
eukprot:1179808-Prorocentrum_minimum.AAC.4